VGTPSGGRATGGNEENGEQGPLHCMGRGNKPARKLPGKIAARWKNKARKEAEEDKHWAEVDKKKGLILGSPKENQNEVSITTNDNSAVRSGDNRKKGA